MSEVQALIRIQNDARVADEMHERSRKMLVDSVRFGAAAGLTQRQISNAMGRSQPEISRLLRFHGQTPLGRLLESKRRPLLKLLASAGGKNVRVFGSVSRGEDKPGSDVDLLIDFIAPVSLFNLSRLEAAAASIVGVSVDVVPSATLRTNVAENVRAEAVPL